MVGRFSKLLLAVLLVNLAGTAFGFFYYQSMFQLFPWPYYIFIPDSPLATLFMAIAVLSILVRRQCPTFTLIAMANSMKYGLWTMLVIVYFPSNFLAPEVENFYYLMFALHFGMVVQPAFILHLVNLGKKEIGIALGWLLLNDFVDYVVWVNPLTIHHLPREGIGEVGYITTFFSFFCILILYLLNREREKISSAWEKVTGEKSIREAEEN